MLRSLPDGSRAWPLPARGSIFDETTNPFVDFKSRRATSLVVAVERLDTRLMSRRILIVEDVDDLRQAYVPWFEANGFEVSEARNGEEALEISGRERPDVVLLDINLPGIDGYSLASLWQRDPRMAQVPVVALTGCIGDEDDLRATHSGCVVTLPKPCMPDVIMAAVRGALPA